MKRIQGFVVGYDKVANELLWTVKVKDQSSHHNGQKFLVASLHPGTMLTRPGVDVTFRVETFGAQQEQVLRAVDVSIGKSFPEENPIMERIPESLNISIAEMIGVKFYAWHTEAESPEEAQEWVEGMGCEDLVVGLIKITPELILKHGGAINDEEAVAGLATMRQMMDINPLRDVLYAVAVEAFRLGHMSKDVNQNQTEN